MTSVTSSRASLRLLKIFALVQHLPAKNGAPVSLLLAVPVFEAARCPNMLFSTHYSYFRDVSSSPADHSGRAV
jgi:hypothetical protein